MGSRARRSFPAHPSALAEVRRFLRGRAEEVSLTPRAIDDLIVAVSEACANAVLHSGGDRVEVTWTTTEDAVEVEVRDHGSFKRRVRMGEIEGPSGYGIPLMMALADEVEIREGTGDAPGTSVRLVKRKT